MNEIDKIEEIRRRNNINWMDLLRLAVKYAPREEVKAVLGRIRERDAQIHDELCTLHDKL